MTIMTLAACGGGGGQGSTEASVSPQPALAIAEPPSTATADVALADRLYKGGARTPAGFDVEARPASVTGTLSTRHLKNTDFALGISPDPLRGVHE